MSLQKYHFSTEKNIGDVSCEAAKRQAEARFSDILACLPRQLQQQSTRMRAGQDDLPARLSEIRLRAGHQAALTLDGGNMLLPLLYHSFKAASIYLWTRYCRETSCQNLYEI